MDRYGETLFVRDGAERKRLELLGEVFDPLSRETLANLGPLEGRRCLEIGAGAGTIANWLSSQVGPGGHVVATDIEVEPLLGLDRPNLSALYHDVTIDEFPEGSFDLIHARLVLGHLHDKDRVLDRITRWLKPGGCLMIEQFSWFTIESSPHSAYRKTFSSYSDVVAATIGTDIRWSRWFPRPLAAHGLDDLGARTHTLHLNGGTPLAEFWMRTLRMPREQLIGGGHLIEQDFERAMEFLRDPDFWDIAPGLAQAWGRRPCEPALTGARHTAGSRGALIPA